MLQNLVTGRQKKMKLTILALHDPGTVIWATSDDLCSPRLAFSVLGDTAETKP